ncbi:hypothetical protein VYU27_008164 [Nannochloropsis oceanica]
MSGQVTVTSCLGTSAVQWPRSPAWLTLALGYVFYFALTIHPFVVLADKEKGEGGKVGFAEGVALIEIALAGLVLLLLVTEAFVALVQTRRYVNATHTQHIRRRISQAAGECFYSFSSLSSSNVVDGSGRRRSSESISASASASQFHDTKTKHKHQQAATSSSPFSLFRLFTKSNFAPTAEQKASLASTLLFLWVNPILMTGKKKILAVDDLHPLEQEDRSAYIWRAFLPHLRVLEEKYAHTYRHTTGHDNAMRKKKIGNGWLLFGALFHTYPAIFISISFYQLVASLCEFGVPLCLKYLVEFIGSYTQSEPIPPEAYAAAAILFTCPALAAFANVQQYCSARRLIFRWRAALIGLVFRQTLRLDPAVSTYSSGQVINLCSVDASNCDALRYFPFLWAVPLEVGISIALIFWVLQCWISGLVGVVLVAASVYITVKLSERLRQAQRTLMQRKDVRLSLLGECLQGIRILKLLAWERVFLGKLEGARATELKALRRFILIRCLISILWTSTPVLVSAATFLFHTLILKKSLSVSQGYATLALFGLLRSPLANLNTYLNSYVKAQVSFGRLERFLFEAPLLQRYEGTLLTDEMEKEDDDEEEEDEEESGGGRPRVVSLRPGEVILHGAQGSSFAWGDSTQGRGQLLLPNVDLHVQPGELVCIYGPTGGCKSSLLMALLGEMRRVGGEGQFSNGNSASSSSSSSKCWGGRVSYVAQRPWILNGTLRDNILFGKHLDSVRYEAALEACALRQDLEALEGGDLTEIGEKGVTLSGGQQQRLSLCRAIYQPTDVLLLDDVLSAVDAHVARHLLTACLKGPLLEGRTVLLVTHQISLTLPVADHVLVLGQDGCVVAQGNPKDNVKVMVELGQYAAEAEASGGVTAAEEAKEEGPDYLGGSKNKVDEKKKLQAAVPSVIQPKSLLTAKGQGKQLVTSEKKAEGYVKLRVYMAYILAAGGFLLAGVALLTFAGVEAFNYFQNKALGDWVEKLEMATKNEDKRAGVYPYIYFSLASIAVVVAQALLTSCASLMASRRIHHNMARRVLRAPMSWFERTPLGRIQNRFSSDMDTIDIDAMDTLSKFLSRLAAILTITAIILHAMAPLILGMIPILLASSYFGYIYQKSARELKRLDSVTRSPIYSHFIESVAGLPTIRAYQQQARFIAESDARIDTNSCVYHHLWSTNRWLAVRLQLLGAAIVGMVGVYILFTLGTVPKTTAALVLLYCMSFSDSMNVLIRQQATLEMDFNSVERAAVEYTLELEQEKAAINPDCRPSSASWPAQGEISVSNLRLSYPGTETDVLQDVSFHIPPRTKVGVVGRTGAGKTSLIAALFRLVEPKAKSGLVIDGQDILQLGLEDLRGRLAIVPQESILFRGTIRSNLDPFQEFLDVDLWAALEKAQLKGRVVKSLEDAVGEGGSNFSVGERALLCFARALLRTHAGGRGVLVLDEATASVDPENDARIQEMTKTQLSNITVLSVAHRLRTVAFYDLVLVLQQGQVLEYGPPLTLLEDPQSAFRAMAQQTGEFEALMAIAKKASCRSSEKGSSIDGGKNDGGVKV